MERVKEGTYYEKNKKKKSKELSTSEREMQDAKFKAAFEHEYAESANSPAPTETWRRFALLLESREPH